ncbi:hypothetical protein NLJ89_g6620 [Agrocybe chaxingu]|uniref:Uncharacterized protein n=1 Tax=Agrocybe chaxingu TaxID=84603 RepID=A0A9W8MW81_9AGAR|nr:hypothetical protein NLJ89_g6620 [Agrocybe chaxingu]
MKSNSKKLVTEFWEAFNLVRNVQILRLNAQEGTEGFRDVDDKGNVVIDRPLGREDDCESFPLPHSRPISSADTAKNFPRFPNAHTLRLYCTEKCKPKPLCEDPVADYKFSLLEYEIFKTIADSKLVNTLQTLDMQDLLPCNHVLRHLSAHSSLLSSLAITDCLWAPGLTRWFWKSATYRCLQYLHLENVGIMIRGV